MLTFILKREWFEKIERGEKTIEYREVKPYWTKRIKSRKLDEASFIEWVKKAGNKSKWTLMDCQFRLGYTKTCLNAVIDRIAIVDGINTDLKIDKPVYAFCFHLAEN